MEAAELPEEVGEARNFRTNMRTSVKTFQMIARVIAITVLWLQAISACRGQTPTPYIPLAGPVTVIPKTNAETVFVLASVDLPDSCHFVGDWGPVQRVGNSFNVDAQFWVVSAICFPVVLTVSTQYNLGSLAPGNYTFVFRSWGFVRATQPFSAPLVLSVQPMAGASQNQFCWNTATNAWYRLESCSTLVTNGWAALTAWVPGDGNRFCTNVVASVGEGRRFYRVAGTNAPPLQ